MTLLGNMLLKIYMTRTSGLFKASPKGWGVIDMQMLIGLTLFSTEHSVSLYIYPWKRYISLNSISAIP